MSKVVIGAAVVLGIVLLGPTAIYWLEPAGSLPTYFPGFEQGSEHIRFKHGLGMLVLAFAIFAFAWFRKGPGKP
jgi:hypothetical protein